MTSSAPYEKSKSLGSGGSMVARLKLKGIDGRAPPGVEPAASTLYANLLWIVAFGIFGTSRTVAQLALSLAVMTFGHQRSTAVKTYLQKHAQATGMGAAEVQGAQANLLAVLKVLVPLMYGNIFAWATSKEKSMPGLPYFLIGALTLCSQMTFSSIDPDK
eukprot:UN1129